MLTNRTKAFWLLLAPALLALAIVLFIPLMTGGITHSQTGMAIQ
ncbi:hypothetical protein I587_02784 [Enterococcus mundtii ATCC 882]|nr:hypothetical protein UAC_00656 [Enterococcus mundtii ATCC 882]EOU14185.1 hypothetical protein I587_02784 [Enterococcus mundtii ATCC 882]